MKKVAFLTLLIGAISILLFITTALKNKIPEFHTTNEISHNEKKLKPLYKELISTEAELNKIHTAVIQGSPAGEKAITPELMAKSIERKKRMYYFAKKDPEIFLKYSLPDSIYKDPQFFSLVEQKDLTFIGTLLFDEESHTYLLENHHFEYLLYIYFPHHSALSIPIGSNVEIKGTKIEDRFVLSEISPATIKITDKRYGQH